NAVAFVFIATARLTLDAPRRMQGKHRPPVCGVRQCCFEFWVIDLLHLSASVKMCGVASTTPHIKHLEINRILVVVVIGGTMFRLLFWLRGTRWFEAYPSLRFPGHVHVYDDHSDIPGRPLFGVVGPKNVRKFVEVGLVENQRLDSLWGLEVQHRLALWDVLAGLLELDEVDGIAIGYRHCHLAVDLVGGKPPGWKNVGSTH